MECSALHRPVGRPEFDVRKALRVGMLGIGTVGGGTYRLLNKNAATIRAHAGCDIVVLMVAARNIARARSIVGADIEVVVDAMRVVEDPRIDVIVEVIGGIEPARTLVLAAITRGKHVVTANKLLLALYGEEIFSAAQARGVMVCFEGAVAVSVPIVKTLREALAANSVEWLAGIVNGTTNFILTEMERNGVSYQEAVEAAQRLGYAETDPTEDVSGHDSACKLALLSSLAFGTPLDESGVLFSGIDSLHAKDIVCASRLGYRLKLLAFARRHPQGVERWVSPALVLADSLLAQVNGVMNAVCIGSDAAGVTMHYGAGAGGDETASAMVADLIDIARLFDAPASCAVPSLGFAADAVRPLSGLDSHDIGRQHYVRLLLTASSRLSNAKATAMRLFSGHGVGVLSSIT